MGKRLDPMKIPLKPGMGVMKCLLPYATPRHATRRHATTRHASRAWRAALCQQPVFSHNTELGGLPLEMKLLSHRTNYLYSLVNDKTREGVDCFWSAPWSSVWRHTHSPASRPFIGSRSATIVCPRAAGWLGAWLAGWLPAWLACWLAGFLAGWALERLFQFSNAGNFHRRTLSHM